MLYGMIPFETFEAALVEKYISLTVALKADRDFSRIKHRGNVKHYNAHFTMCRDELALMHHVSQPDAITRIKIYIVGRKPALQAALHSRVKQADLKSLDALMSIASETESVDVSLNFISGQAQRSERFGRHNRVL